MLPSSGSRSMSSKKRAAGGQLNLATSSQVKTYKKSLKNSVGQEFIA
jgi:hypothetical protein